MIMRKKAECMITFLLIFALMNCLVVTDYAFADRKSQPRVQGISYPQAENNVSPLTFADVLERMVTLREDIIDVIDHFNPDMAAQMQQKNNLLRDLLDVLNDLPRKTLSRPN
jgi:hypothetical protein